MKVIYISDLIKRQSFRSDTIVACRRIRRRISRSDERVSTSTVIYSHKHHRYRTLPNEMCHVFGGLNIFGRPNQNKENDAINERKTQMRKPHQGKEKANEMKRKVVPLTLLSLASSLKVSVVCIHLIDLVLDERQLYGSVVEVTTLQGCPSEMRQD